MDREWISVKNLSYTLRNRPILRDLNFSVTRGECLALMGTNGAGKSTTLNILAGLTRPTTGQIFLCGYNIQESPGQIKQMLGFLPEAPTLYHELTVEEYLLFVATLRKIPKQCMQQTLTNTLHSLDLMKMKDTIIGTLSKGTQQRVAIAQAILHKPAILILDEPTQGLDKSHIEDFQHLIKNLKKQTAIILSTHDFSEVEPFCDTLLEFQTGISKQHDLHPCAT